LRRGRVEVSRIELAPEVGQDFDRIVARLAHLVHYPVENPELRIREIINSLDVLEHCPRIGRPVSDGTRER
jgi:toxin ParE1/3/4